MEKWKRGDPMPQTPEQWAYMHDCYEKALAAAVDRNSNLRITINNLRQQLERAEYLRQQQVRYIKSRQKE